MDNRKTLPLLLVAALAFLAALPAGATDWCGANGVVRFDLVEGDGIDDILDAGEPEGGVTKVTVTAWLTDVAPVWRDGERFLHLGGFETTLDIQGAEAFILKQVFPSKNLNVGRRQGNIAVGLVPGERITDGRVQLVTWEVMFQGRPENVRFGLAQGGTSSCGTVAGCPEADPPLLYVGVESSDQLGDMFGAGYVPAWLNPVGEPDRTPVGAGPSFAEVGLYAAAD